MLYTNHFHDIFKGFYICLMFDVSKRPTSYRVDVVPSFQLFLITFLVGSKRWGDACAYHGPPLDQPRGQTVEQSFSSLTL